LAAVPMLPHPAAASPAPAGSAELAVYATRLPDPARLHYRLLRGASVGTATLHWQRGEGGDALRLDVEWPTLHRARPVAGRSVPMGWRCCAVPSCAAPGGNGL
jgi:hypothetical protein